MKIRYLILIIVILLLTPFVLKTSFAIDDDQLTSTNYVIKDNTIYAIPTSFEYKVDELIYNVDYIKTIEAYNNTTKLNNDDNIGTGSIIKNNKATYNVVVLGDISGDGTISLGDVSYLYNYYRGKSELSGLNLEAAKLTGNDDIGLGDVSKLYNFYRGKKAFTFYSDKDFVSVRNYLSLASEYYENNKTSNKLGTNIIDELNIEDREEKDQIVVTKEGKVELAISRNNRCYRKYSNSDDIELIENRSCNANIDDFVSNSGYLHVSGSKLLDEDNREVKLVGTTSGIYFDSETQNVNQTSDEFFKTMKSWGTNVFRIFIGSKFYDKTSENYDAYFEKLKQVINSTINQDMYIIINYDPAGFINEENWQYRAEEFFNEVLDIYGNDKHIIYEIWNEPNASTSWSAVKEYANKVIPVIREKAPDSIILVGTPNFDKRVDKVIGNQLNYNNIMYTYHMYTPGVTEENLNYFIEANEAGLPIFVSEWAGVVGNPPNRADYINEAHANAFAKLLKKYNSSYIMFTSGRSVWSYGFIFWYDHTWDARYPEKILSKNGLLFKRLLYNDYSTDHYLMVENSDNEGKYYRSSEYKDKIVSVSFKKGLSVPTNAIKQWDLSQAKDESIIGYLVPSSEDNMYDLVIVSDGIINLPIISRNLFEGLTKVKSYDFSNVETDLIMNMSYIFKNNNSLLSIDLSSFDVTNLRYMYGLFQNDSSLKSINFEGWNPSIEGLTHAFYNCSSLEELDLSNFDVSKTNNFSNLFYKNSSLKELDLSNWNPDGIANVSYMFKSTTSLTRLDISGFKNFSEGYNNEHIFDYINSEVEIITGDENFKNDMISLYPDLNIK